MEDNKYYTPEIEEFYEGFEYESKTYWIREKTESWKKEIFTIHSYAGYDGEYFLKDHIEQGYVRVKYLDREDIEECKWEHDQTTKDGAVFYIGTLMDQHQWCLTAYNAILKKGEDYTLISIYDANDKYGLGNGFQGVVKNKSELKKVMKMLGI